MEIVKLDAKARPLSGKGPAKRLRQEGQIPAVAYGKNLAATSIAISPKLLLKTLESEHGKNSVLELNVDGGSKITVMIRDYSYHPVSRELLHADFIQIQLDQSVDAEVPFECVGKPAGVVLGGVLQQVFRKLPVRCLPEQIPTKIQADVSSLGLNALMKVGDLQLPEGVSVRLPAEQTIASVSAPEREEATEAAAPAAAGKEAKKEAPKKK